MIAVSAVASSLVGAAELSPAARRLGADLLGSAAGRLGVVTESIEDLGARVGVSWNRARVLLGELAASGFVVYWSYEAGGKRWALVSWLAWSLGVPRAQPPAVAGLGFGDRSGEIGLDAELTQNVLGDQGAGAALSPVASPVPAAFHRSLEIGSLDHDHDLDHINHRMIDHDQRNGAAGGAASELTQNVLGDQAGGVAVTGEGDRIVALLVDVGVLRSYAVRFAASFDLWSIYGHVCQWRRDLERAKRPIGNPAGLLVRRLSSPADFTAPRVDASDRCGELWDRYMAPGAELAPAGVPAELTQNVLGDGVAVGVAVTGAELAPAVGADDSGDWWGEMLEEIRRDAPDLGQWLRGSSGVCVGDRLLISVPPHRLDWCRARLSPWLRRRLAIIINRPGLQVEIAGIGGVNG